jgi:hypothetical protein
MRSSADLVEHMLNIGRHALIRPTEVIPRRVKPVEVLRSYVLDHRGERRTMFFDALSLAVRLIVAIDSYSSSLRSPKPS